MTPETAPQAKYNTPLRQAQREMTRNRIKNAARSLFYEQHYDTTTMDEIAVAAGLRRSTLYLHYKDKTGILLDIIAEYSPKARAVLATLPGPAPSIGHLRAWIGRVAAFVAEESAPLSIIQEARARSRDAAAFETITRDLLRAIGTNNPPFADAAQADAPPVLRARAMMLLEELTYACGISAEDPAAAIGDALRQVAAEDFHRFLAG